MVLGLSISTIRWNETAVLCESLFNSFSHFRLLSDLRLDACHIEIGKALYS